jgi:hypothetical protein
VDGGAAVTGGAYDGGWQRLRRSLLAALRDGDPCGRCGRPMYRSQARYLDVGHVVDVVAGGRLADGARLEHRRCNRGAGGRVGAARASARRKSTRRRRRVMLAQVAVGVEISEDRENTSVAVAGFADGVLVLELAAYLPGPDAGTGEVLALRAARTVLSVVVDPRSPGATLIRPLEAAGVAVTQLTTSDVVVAQGEFMDALKGGRLKIVAAPELDRAARLAMTRPLAGGSAWDRRAPAVDVSPLTAGTWAVWAALHAAPAQFFAAWR